MATYRYLDDGTSDGTILGQTATVTKVGFWGAAPVVQSTAAAQAAITDGSTGAAAPTNGVAALTGTYNSTILANALATIIAQGNAIRAALVNCGIIKGS